MHFSNLRQYPNALPALGNVLLKGRPLSQTRHAQQLLRETHAYARTLVRDAQKTAFDCHQHAAKAGFEAGFIEVIEHALHYLCECRRVHLQLRERMQADVHDALDALLGDPKLVVRVTDSLAERRRDVAHLPMRVTLPKHAREIAMMVRKRLTRTWPEVEIVYTDSDTRAFFVEWGEEVLEFDPEQCTAQLTDAALAATDEAIAAIDHHALAHSLFSAAVQQLEPMHHVDRLPQP